MLQHNRCKLSFRVSFLSVCLCVKQLQTPSIKARRSNMIGWQLAFRVSFLSVCLCVQQLQTPSIKARCSNMIGWQLAFRVFFSGCLSLHEATPNTLYKSPAFEHYRVAICFWNTLYKSPAAERDRVATCFSDFVSDCLSLHQATPNTLYKSPAFEHDRVAICFPGFFLGACLCMKQLQAPSLKARRSNIIG